MTLLRWLATVALATTLATLAVCAVPVYAQTDQGRLTGTGCRATPRARRSRARRSRPQRAHRRGARVVQRRGLRPDRPAAVHLHDQGTYQGFAPVEYTGVQLAGGAGVPARPDAPGRRRAGGRHGAGRRRRSISARRASASTSPSAKSTTCRSTAGRCRS